jgi:hypothetical protein
MQRLYDQLAKQVKNIPVSLSSRGNTRSLRGGLEAELNTRGRIDVAVQQPGNRYGKGRGGTRQGTALRGGRRGREMMCCLAFVRDKVVHSGGLPCDDP